MVYTYNLTHIGVDNKMRRQQYVICVCDYAFYVCVIIIWVLFIVFIERNFDFMERKNKCIRLI